MRQEQTKKSREEVFLSRRASANPALLGEGFADLLASSMGKARNVDWNKEDPKAVGSRVFGDLARDLEATEDLDLFTKKVRAFSYGLLLEGNVRLAREIPDASKMKTALTAAFVDLGGFDVPRKRIAVEVLSQMENFQDNKFTALEDKIDGLEFSPGFGVDGIESRLSSRRATKGESLVQNAHKEFIARRIAASSPDKLGEGFASLLSESFREVQSIQESNREGLSKEEKYAQMDNALEGLADDLAATQDIGLFAKKTRAIRETFEPIIATNPFLINTSFYMRFDKRNQFAKELSSIFSHVMTHCENISNHELTAEDERLPKLSPRDRSGPSLG